MPTASDGRLLNPPQTFDRLFAQGAAFSDGSLPCQKLEAHAGPPRQMSQENAHDGPQWA